LIGTEKRKMRRVVNPAPGGSLGELPLVDAVSVKAVGRDRALETMERAFRHSRQCHENRSANLQVAAGRRASRHVILDQWPQDRD
jgi:hypothetical protein